MIDLDSHDPFGQGVHPKGHLPNNGEWDAHEPQAKAIGAGRCYGIIQGCGDFSAHVNGMLFGFEQGMNKGVKAGLIAYNLNRIVFG